MDERRQFQRLRLIKPILAAARGEDVLILDIGVAGALIEHRFAIQPGVEFPLSFRWQGEEIEYLCEVARTERHGNVSHSGLRFLAGTPDSARLLRDLMASFVSRVVTAQKTNAAGEARSATGETLLEQLGHARSARTPDFAAYRYIDGNWKRTVTSSPVQPPDGFTVAAHEDEEELTRLCQTYEDADDEGRKLIRLVAELSITDK